MCVCGTQGTMVQWQYLQCSVNFLYALCSHTLSGCVCSMSSLLSSWVGEDSSVVTHLRVPACYRLLWQLCQTLGHKKVPEALLHQHTFISLPACFPATCWLIQSQVTVVYHCCSQWQAAVYGLVNTTGEWVWLVWLVVILSSDTSLWILALARYTFTFPSFHIYNTLDWLPPILIFGGKNLAIYFFSSCCCCSRYWQLEALIIIWELLHSRMNYIILSSTWKSAKIQNYENEWKKMSQLLNANVDIVYNTRVR